MADPLDIRLAQLLAEQQSLATTPAKPIYSPEEVAQRRNANQFQEQWGALGQMSGDEQMQGIGGSYLKKALADRATKETEAGVMDPIEGSMKYFPQYLAQRRGEQIDKALDRGYLEKSRQQDRSEARADRLAAGGGAGVGSSQIAGYGANGESVFRPNKGGALFAYDNGNPVPYTGKLFSKEAVPAQTQREISDKTAYLGEHQMFEKSFKPEFAGTAPGIGNVEAYMGRYTGGKMQPMAEWWQAYRNWTINLRRDLFGTALTAPEKALFEEANVEPGMHPSVIQNNLKRQQHAIINAVNKQKAPYANRPGMEPLPQIEMPLPGQAPVGSPKVINRQGPIAQMLGMGGAAPTVTPQQPPMAPQGSPVPQTQPNMPVNPGGGWNVRRMD